MLKPTKEKSVQTLKLSKFESFEKYYVRKQLRVVYIELLKIDMHIFKMISLVRAK